MVRLVVHDQQIETLKHAPGMIEVTDPTGRLLGYFHPTFSPEEVSAARAGLNGPHRQWSTEDVLEHLAGLSAAGN